MKKHWIVIGILLVLVIAGLVKIWPEAKRTYAMIKQERELKNLETEVVRIELAGQSFNIPLRYMYGEAIEKYHRWPTAKKERVKVGALHLSVLLPDMRPYYPEEDARWKVRGHGDRVEVSMMAFRGPSENWGKRNKLNIALIEKFISEGRFYKKSNDVYNLTHYTEIHYKGLEKQPYDAGDTYFAKDRQMEVNCDREKPGFSPSCKVKSDYRQDIVLEYYYGIQHLAHWREIDNALKAMFDKFGKAAQSEPSHKEE